MTEQSQQEAFTNALTKESNDIGQNTSKVNVENKKVTIENENSGQNLLEKNKDSEENKIDMNSINDMASSTGETKEDENPEKNLLIENKNLVENKSDTTLVNDTNDPSSTSEIVNMKEDENPEGNLLKENKNLNDNKSDTTLINGTNDPPSTDKTVDRKVTIEEDTEDKNLDDTNSKNDANNSTASTSETVDVAIPQQKKKKKKKKKKKSGNDESNLDFHDIGPIEEDENRLYDPSKSLTHRVEIAVQKYKKNRKFTSTRNQVFNSYLRFGGISTGPKSFLGQDGLDNADADAEEIAARRATDYIDDEADDMEVNFTYIVRVYLSSFLIDKSGYVQMDQFREGPQVVISFLNYLHNHKVCPEYEEDMQTALQIANKAKEELPNCKALAQNAPGKLNKACSLLFGGELYGMLDDPWNGEEIVASMIGISKGEGKQLIRELFGANAVEELTRVKEDSKTALICEIIGVEPFQRDISEASADETLQNSNELHNTQETDLKKIKLREFDVSTAEPFYICVNSDLGIYAMPGMRITADFHKLSNGFWYWDKVTNVYPSYYQPCEDDSDDDD
ncbi:uncharacterized protein OCT59_020800 [Rhizophagus irregularis]|uniref:Argonaute binding protein 1 n=1 Tax=Rhizophagus irregularis (strain DAOM 197198w) TaxID=1432141 RepID=A0A015IZZ1_RHIIW|nr:hypothetical protein RirG_157990 [Rhizophagus irregularis DAOM 197198w]UZO02317.1 hypothetical protein OCT59_020800 [Rhizophagus irregularis]GBC26657.2 argonaute complex, subunit Arb1 [Rhizophagus irregularis DAOM 181602=DAOM 197198]CAB4470534.1 unnamed protein product [Rhizophagus irregularis]